MVHVNVGSRAGSYNIANRSFFQYVVRLGDHDLDLCLDPQAQEALSILAAIPDAACDDFELSGPGWRVIPAICEHDWPVMEITPRRLRSALQTARRVLWEHAGPIGISAPEIVSIDEEFDHVLAVVLRAEEAGFSVSVSYVS
ncbi:MAG TPA: hypothetical protein VGZ00_12170 [Candidatus Baltobacteraceae bacterium]|jgi:hypothetical protein|nr:hypothetical protein [Candidatus Baltobacteraceae bacterium]